MTHSYAFASEPLSSDDLNLLHGTLRKWCDERGVKITAPEAEQAAVELIDWFQFGLRHEDQLIEMIRRS
ncbi:hypothetical protein G8E10_23030 [Rhizobiaceae bacterium CRRU44]|uniref:Uncharacterized protein n=1 Tax=Ferranicluibacter rubi TaxID=2715133 RepID=A0AA43ZKC6_9HYPH|nr:hypothetical protein [Ferranicluibacter rubi]NHT78581.1 hypothetical protein [Ferranicluibacter rubi]